MTSKLNLATSLGKKLVAHYGRPNKFITWYCNKKNLSGSWLTAAWCAMLASFVYDAAGLAGDVGGAWAYCPSWVAWYKSKKRWGTTPKVGATVFYDWNGDGEADHVGIVTAVSASSIKSLEGNTTKSGATNWVAEQTRKRSLAMGYGYVEQAPVVRTYTVAKGDTLAKIAKIYGMTWQTLYAKNKTVIGPKAELIKPGMILTIP